MSIDPVVIAGIARTPMGAFQGELKEFTASELGAVAIRAAVERAGIPANDVEEVILGCVLPAGQARYSYERAQALRGKREPSAISTVTGAGSWARRPSASSAGGTRARLRSLNRLMSRYHKPSASERGVDIPEQGQRMTAA